MILTMIRNTDLKGSCPVIPLNDLQEDKSFIRDLAMLDFTIMISYQVLKIATPVIEVVEKLDG